MRKTAAIVCLGLVGFAIGTGASACSSDDSSAPADSGTKDQSAADVGVVNLPCNGVQPTMVIFDPKTGKDGPPDWSCYASGDAGFLVLDGGDDGGDAAVGDDGGTDSSTADAGDDGGTDASTSDGGGTEGGTTTDAGPNLLHLTDFVTLADSIGTTVDLFLGGSADKTPDFTGTTDDKGIFRFFSPPGSSIFVFKAYGTGLSPIYWYGNLIWPPPTTSEASSITQGGVSLLTAGVLGSSPPVKGSATAVQGVRDCQDRDVRGATVELIDDATGQPVPSGTTGSMPRVAYFLNRFPNEQCTFTNNDYAVWAMLNAPVNMPGHTHGYTMRIHGKFKDTDDPSTLVGETEVELWPDGITIARAYRRTPPPAN